MPRQRLLEGKVFRARPEPPESFATCKAECRYLLSEATAPQLALVSGCEKIVCVDVELPGCLLVLDATRTYGLQVETPTQGDRTRCFEAVAPLFRPSLEWGGLETDELLHTLRALGEGESAVPLIGDVDYLKAEGNGTLTLMRCRRGLGCKPAFTVGLKLFSEGAEEGLNTYRPLIIVPGILWSFRLRVARKLRLTKPWLCIEAGSEARAFVCLEDKCHFEVRDDGIVRLIYGRAAILRLRRCRTSYIWHIWFYTKLYSTLRRVIKYPRACEAPLYMIGRTLIPSMRVQEEDGRLLISTMLANPCTTALRVTLLSSTHKLEKAEAFSYASRCWDELQPTYDRLKILIPPLALIHVRVVLKPLPSILVKRRMYSDIDI